MSGTPLARLIAEAEREIGTEPERHLLEEARRAGLPIPAREYVFDPTRKWRFDAAWPERKIAAEIDGGTRSGGRHVRGDGYERDCVKINAATLAGWSVYRFTTSMVNDGRALATLEEALR